MLKTMTMIMTMIAMIGHHNYPVDDNNNNDHDRYDK